MGIEISEDKVQLSGRGIRVALRSHEGSWYLSCLEDGSGRLLVSGSHSGSLWALRANTEGKLVEATSQGLTSSVRPAGASSMEIAWPAFNFMGSECNARLRLSLVSSVLICAKLGFRFNPAIALWEVDFPILEGLNPENATLYAPYGYGKAIPYGGGTRYRGTYPSHHCAMQFLAWNTGPASLYVGCHDPCASTKTLEFSPQPPTLRCTLPVAGMGDDFARYEVPYPVAVGAIPGDWYDVALFYRRWAMRQSWSRARPLASRPTPRALKDVALWCCASGAPGEVVPKALQFARYFGVATALHWYVWHEIPFDDHYPEYFPAKEGFKEAIAKLGAAGILVMPYINARLWDPATESWSREGAESAAAKDADLKKYTEVYGSKVPLSPMCPTTQLWGRKIRSIVKRLASEYRVHGVYLDQIGAAAPKLCFDRGHGHPVGGGDWWVRGYRDILEKVRRDVQGINPEFFITTESNAEPWNDLLDALLMCNSTEGELAPIYPAVYADRVLIFGAYIFRRDLEDSWAFRVKVSQMFLWGTQLGWLGFDVLEPRFQREAEYLRCLAHARSSTSLLSGGELLRPPRPDPEVDMVEASWELWGRTWNVRLPAAQATAWRGPDGSVGVVACNMGDASTDLRVSLDIAELGWTKAKAFRMMERTQLGSANPSLDGKALCLRLELPPRCARLVSSTDAQAEGA